MEQNGQKITLRGGGLTAQISTKGAELQSLTDQQGTEWIWQGDANYWEEHSPLLFPICGGLKEDCYWHQGSRYSLNKHGFASKEQFEVEHMEENRAVFLLRSHPDTLACYPFAFELRVIYILKDGKMEVSYEVKNTGGETMYFSIGAHEGYACPEGIEAYSVWFDEEETLDRVWLDGNLLTDETQRVLEKGRELPLRNGYFAADALVFKNIRSRGVVLKNNQTGKQIRVTFEGFDYFLLWTKPGAPYLCIEPWCGIPDGVHTDQQLAHKEGIESIQAGKIFRRVHTVSPWANGSRDGEVR